MRSWCATFLDYVAVSDPLERYLPEMESTRAPSEAAMPTDPVCISAANRNRAAFAASETWRLRKIEISKEGRVRWGSFHENR